MNVKKILAGAVASVMALSTMAVVASAAEPTIEEGVFVLGVADNDWKASFWGKSDDTLDASYETTAKLNGNGTYTVAIDLSKGYQVDREGFLDEATGEPLTLTTGNGIGAMGVQIYGDYPTLGVDITKIVIDGVDQPLTGVSYTNDEDGGRRTNLYNEWASFDASKEDHISKDPDKASSTLFDKSSLTEWSKIEVTFDVYGLEDEGNAGDGTANDNNTADNGDTNAPTADKNTPDTGVEGVAVVAGLAIVAAGAVVVAKKRK